MTDKDDEQALITQKQWNAKLRELRVARERIAALEVERAEWMAQQDCVSVPREPTVKMQDAAMSKARYEYGHGVTRSSIVAIYRAMLAASKEKT